jgi:hypothetical protein
MTDLTRRLLLQLSLAGTASACSNKTNVRSPLEELWAQRIPLLRERLAIEGRGNLNSAHTRAPKSGLSWDAIKMAMDAIEQQIWTLPPDADTIAARLLIDSENYSLETATEIGSPRESLRWIADAYLRTFKPSLSSVLFRST